MCHEASLVLQLMHLMLAALLHGFEILTPSDETVDMSKKVGINNVKPSPLDVLLVPRLPIN